MTDSKKIIISVLGLTFIYINTSLFLFYQNWILSPLSYIVSSIFLLYSVFQFRKIEVEKDDKIRKVNLMSILLISIVLTLISGISGFGGISTFDINHHLQKVVDISQLDWPIYYSEPNTFASYYFGFYLLPGLLNSFLGNVKIITFFWDSLGLFIGIFWILIFFNSSLLRAVFVFCHSGLLSIIFPILNQEILFYSKYFYFSDVPWFLLPNYLSLRWVPNQFIYSLILVGVLLNFVNTKNIYYLTTLIISGLFWAPFPTLFIGIFYVVKLSNNFREKSQMFGYDSFCYIVINLFLLSFVFLLLVSNETSQSFTFSITSTERFVEYLYLTIFEVLVFYLLIKKEYRKRADVVIAFVILIFLPLFKLGNANDLYARGSVPMILILFLYFIKSIDFTYLLHFRNVTRIILIVSLSFLPAKYFVYGLVNFKIDLEYKKSRDVYTLIKKDYQSKKIADQYLINSNSIFYRYLLNKSNVRNSELKSF